MFSDKDRVHINGDLDKIKHDVVEVQTELRAHQTAFEKHEKLDNERYQKMEDNVKDFHKENTEQHESIKVMINKNSSKLAWILGIGVTVWFFVQLFLSGTIKLSFGI